MNILGNTQRLRIFKVSFSLWASFVAYCWNANRHSLQSLSQLVFPLIGLPLFPPIGLLLFSLYLLLFSLCPFSLCSSINIA